MVHIVLPIIAVIGVFIFIWALLIHDEWVSFKDKRLEKKLGQRIIFKNILKTDINRFYNIESYKDLEYLSFRAFSHEYFIEKIRFKIEIDIHSYFYNVFYLIAVLYIDGDVKEKIRIYFWQKEFKEIKRIHKKFYKQVIMDRVDKELSYLPKSIKTKEIFKKL